MSLLREREREREVVSPLRQRGSVCIETERVCLHSDREGLSAFRERGSVCIKTERVCLH